MLSGEGLGPKRATGKGIDIDGEVSLIPSNMIAVSEEQSNKILTLLDQLDNHDDIQKVHTNFEIE